MTSRKPPFWSYLRTQPRAEAGVDICGFNNSKALNMVDEHNTTVVEVRRSSGAGLIAAVALLIAVVAGVYLFSQSSNSEVAKDNAVAGAANNVGNAAESVGDAAKDAGKDAAN